MTTAPCDLPRRALPFPSRFFFFVENIPMQISIVCDSGYGHTAKPAQSVAQGVRSVAGAEARLAETVRRLQPA
ncbi:conserved hypothetical protein [Ralstonia solanacearum Po82]|uniref:Flavodoxin-like domain-containing protein n=1 Tax=Ralstonia solanacearum (strain Po82) TaxID=1031711 RepID=F6G047_RALS8|nr:conserved hypothetical protein [Ralstonia solanacearum Po82]